MDEHGKPRNRTYDQRTLPRRYACVLTAAACFCVCCAGTMVFRGFQTANERPGQEAFKLITDARSDKVQPATTTRLHVHARAHPDAPPRAQVQQGPSCELVWWFSRSSEQFRVSGSLQFVGSDEQGELRGVREEQWKRLSDPAREQFYWKQPWVAYEGSAEPPKVCGRVDCWIPNSSYFFVACCSQGGRDADGAVMAPPDTFLLMLLWPNQVKYLNLRNNFAQLDVREEGEWRGSRTNP